MGVHSTGLSRDERGGQAMADAFADVRSVGTSVACQLIPCSIATLHKLIKRGELESFLDGKHRRVTVRSIVKRRDRLLAEASKAVNAPPRGRGRPRKSPAIALN